MEALGVTNSAGQVFWPCYIEEGPLSSGKNCLCGTSVWKAKRPYLPQDKFWKEFFSNAHQKANGALFLICRSMMKVARQAIFRGDDQRGVRLADMFFHKIPIKAVGPDPCLCLCIISRGGKTNIVRSRCFVSSRNENSPS